MTKESTKGGVFMVASEVAIFANIRNLTSQQIPGESQLKSYTPDRTNNVLLGVKLAHF
jgi:hypothetical protein